MDFLILGPLEVLDSGRALTLGGAKRRALLAILLIHADTVVSVDRLTDLMWGDGPPSTASKIIQVYVSQLRKLFSRARSGHAPRQILTTEPSGYAVRLAPDELDSVRFEDLLHAGRQAMSNGNHRVACERLRDALSLWRGPAPQDAVPPGA